MTAEQNHDLAALQPTPTAAPAAEPPGLFATSGYLWLCALSFLLSSATGAFTSGQTALANSTDDALSAFRYIAFAVAIGALLGYGIVTLYADRIGKRLLLRRTLAFTMILCIVVAIVAGFAQSSVVALYVLFALVSGVQGLLTVALWSWTAELLPRRLIPRGIVVLSLVSFGSALAPILLSFTYPDFALTIHLMSGVALACYAIAALVTSRLPASTPSVPTNDSPVASFKAGAAHVWSHGSIRPILLFTIVFVVIQMFAYLAQVSWFYEVAAVYSLDFAWLALSSGVASIVTSLALAFWINQHRSWPLIVGGSFLFAVSLLAMASVSNDSLLILLGAPYGAANGSVLLLASAIVLTESRFGFHGRTIAILFFGQAVGGLVGTSVLQTTNLYGHGQSILVAGGLAAFTLALWLLRHWRRHGGSPPDSGPQDAALALNPLVDSTAPQKRS